MNRPVGFTVYKTNGMLSPEIEYVYPTSQALLQGQLVKQGSTMSGHVGHLTTGSLGTDLGKCFVLQAAVTAETSQTKYPAIRLNNPNITWLVGHASSNSTAAISTTAIGQCCVPCSSGGVVVGTSGQFRITAVFNTSDYTKQAFAGQFVASVTTN